MLFAIDFINRDFTLDLRGESEGIGGPKFSSSPSEERLLVGDKVTLKCSVENLGESSNYFKICNIFLIGESTVIWKKDGRMISAGQKLIRKDLRMSLRGFNLAISETVEEDMGEYICNVETFGEPLDQVHKLDILGKVGSNVIDTSECLL